MTSIFYNYSFVLYISLMGRSRRASRSFSVGRTVPYISTSLPRKLEHNRNGLDIILRQGTAYVAETTSA